MEAITIGIRDLVAKRLEMHIVMLSAEYRSVLTYPLEAGQERPFDPEELERLVRDRLTAALVNPVTNQGLFGEGGDPTSLIEKVREGHSPLANTDGKEA